MGITSKEQKEEVVNILLKTIDTVKKRQEEEYYKELATIITGLNGGEKTSSMALKSKAIDDKYKEILAHLNSENKSGSISNEEFEKLNADAKLKQQAERNALLLAGINDYKSKESALLAEWDAKIAQAQGNSNALSLLETGKSNALNGLHLEAVKGMSEWSELFTNLDSLSISEIGKLSKSIREKSKELKLDPVKSGEMVKELDKAEAEIRSRNPFSSLLKSIKDYKSAENETFKDNALKNIFMDSASSFDMVKGSLTAVTSGLDELGLSGNEATKEVLGDITNLMGGFSEIATGFATKNPVAILKGTMGVFTSVFNLFDGRSRFANKIIKENAVELKKLGIAYKDLEEKMKSTLGGEHFQLQLKQMKNLEEQQQKIQNQFNVEDPSPKKIIRLSKQAYPQRKEGIRLFS